MSFLSTKAVPVSKNAQNLTAAIVKKSTTAAPFLRFAFDTVSDFGASSSGKMNSVSNCKLCYLNDATEGIRVTSSAYRKSAIGHADVIEMIKKEAAKSKIDEHEATTIGVPLPIRGNARGCEVHGNAADGSIYIDIPKNTIAILSNPNVTFKERDAVAAPSAKGKTRLIASSGGFSSVLDSAIGLSFNIMLDIDATIDPKGLATALGLTTSDPLFADLTDGASSAPSEADETAAGAPASFIKIFNEKVRAILASLTQEQVLAAVKTVFNAKVAIEAAKEGASAKTAFQILSAWKVDSVRQCVTASLVESAIAKVRLDHIVGGSNVSDFQKAVPVSNEEICDILESSPNSQAVKTMIKEALLEQLSALESSASEPVSKKNRKE